MKITVILVAAGQSTRFKSNIPKPFVMLHRKPVIAHSLTVFEHCSNIESVIIVGSKDYLKRFEALGRKFAKIKAVVPGGKTRAESVQCGLAALDKSVRHVFVHDAARPLIDEPMLKRLAQALQKHKAVIAAVPVKATIKQVDATSLRITATPSRSLLWEAQTPQGFDRNVLQQAHAQEASKDATDDAMLVERLGIKVNVVMGDYRNIKITTPEDILIAKVLL